MRALILVLDMPYFVMSDTDARYRRSGPGGHYTLKAWLTSKTTREQSVSLTNGATLNVNFL
jgi:hypothetical protein